jgi:acyl-CoA thioester hydrolase
MLPAMEGRFAVRLGVRSYEIDVNGHVNHANYHRYGEYARTEHLSAAGVTLGVLSEAGMGVVLLETHCRFLSELRHRDEVEVSSHIAFGEGRTFRFAHTLSRCAREGVAGDEPVVAAEITCRMGLLDAAARRLLPQPRERLLELATEPGLLGAA